jgi:hypothetical protein
MKSFLALLFGLLAITSIFANPSKSQGPGPSSSLYKYSEMDLFIKSLWNLEELPNQDTQASQIEAGSESLAQETIDIFRRIQSSLFKRSLIDLKPCSDCFALADHAAKTIYVQPSYANSLIGRYGGYEGQRLIEFMIAHELSHFVHEISIGPGSEPHRSINGNSFLHNVHRNNSEEGGRKSHAEVDAYAFMLMKNSNKSSPLMIIQRWFVDTAEEVKKSGNPDDIDVVVKDLENRSRNAELVIEKLWPNSQSLIY